MIEADLDPIFVVSPQVKPFSEWKSTCLFTDEEKKISEWDMLSDTTLPSLPVHADIDWWEKEFKALVALQGNATGTGMAKYLHTILTQQKCYTK